MKYTAADIDRYIDLYLNSFEKVLYEEDSQFMEGMKLSLIHIFCNTCNRVGRIGLAYDIQRRLVKFGKINHIFHVYELIRIDLMKESSGNNVRKVFILSHSRELASHIIMGNNDLFDRVSAFLRPMV